MQPPAVDARHWQRVPRLSSVRQVDSRISCDQRGDFSGNMLEGAPSNAIFFWAVWARIQPSSSRSQGKARKDLKKTGQQISSPSKDFLDRGVISMTNATLSATFSGLRPSSRASGTVPHLG